MIGSMYCVSLHFVFVFVYLFCFLCFILSTFYCGSNVMCLFVFCICFLGTAVGMSVHSIQKQHNTMRRNSDYSKEQRTQYREQTDKVHHSPSPQSFKRQRSMTPHGHSESPEHSFRFDEYKTQSTAFVRPNMSLPPSLGDIHSELHGSNDVSSRTQGVNLYQQFPPPPQNVNNNNNNNHNNNNNDNNNNNNNTDGPLSQIWPSLTRTASVYVNSLMSSQYQSNETPANSPPSIYGLNSSLTLTHVCIFISIVVCLSIDMYFVCYFLYFFVFVLFCFYFCEILGRSKRTRFILGIRMCW